jgi:hypothetical protein
MFGFVKMIHSSFSAFHSFSFFQYQTSWVLVVKAAMMVVKCAFQGFLRMLILPQHEPRLDKIVCIPKTDCYSESFQLVAI